MSHYLTVQPCDHEDCDGPDDCAGFHQQGYVIECDSAESADCRWRCDPCGVNDGEWTYAGDGWCGNDHRMTPCACLVVDWFGATGDDLDDVLGDAAVPRVGRHEVTDWWDGGYQLSYKDAADGGA